MSEIGTMRELTFNLCNCGSFYWHGRFHDEDGRIASDTFMSKEEARAAALGEPDISEENRRALMASVNGSRSESDFPMSAADGLITPIRPLDEGGTGLLGAFILASMLSEVEDPFMMSAADHSTMRRASRSQGPMEEGLEVIEVVVFLL